MRIVIVVGSEKIPNFIGNLIRGLQSEGVNVFLYGKNLRKSDWVNINLIQSDYKLFGLIRIIGGVFFSLIRKPSLVFHAWRLVDDSRYIKVRMKRWYRIIRILEVSPDVVHFQWVQHIQDFQKFILWRGVRVVASLRGTQVNVTPHIDPSVGALYRKLFPVLYFHAVSEAMKNKVCEWGVHPENVRVIYSPTPQYFFDAFSAKRQRSTGPLKILSIGRFHWIKGYSYAIEAIAELKTHGADVTYTIVSQGEVPGEIQYQIRDRNLKDVVRIVGGIPNREVASTMKDYDLFLLPSVEEGIANVVLEAMAVGLPVITTDCGGMKEVVVDKKTGWIVPVRDKASIANAVRKYLQLSEDGQDQVSERAHLQVREQFSFKSNINQFISLYSWIRHERP